MKKTLGLGLGLGEMVREWLMYLFCPRWYHETVYPRHSHIHQTIPLRDEFEGMYADTPVLDDIEL